VTFSCLSKRKSPKRKTPRSRRIPLALLARAGARQLIGRRQRGSTRTRGSLEYSRSGCDARRRLRGLENPRRLVSRFSTPYSAPRLAARAPKSRQGGARDRAGRPPAQGCAVGRPREREARGVGAVAPSGERAFFGDFLCTSKYKFDGIEFGQAKPARRARTRDGPSPSNPGYRGGATRN